MPEPLLIVLLTWKATVLSCVSWRGHRGRPRCIVLLHMAIVNYQSDSIRDDLGTTLVDLCHMSLVCKKCI